MLKGIPGATISLSKKVLVIYNVGITWNQYGLGIFFEASNFNDMRNDINHNELSFKSRHASG